MWVNKQLIQILYVVCLILFQGESHGTMNAYLCGIGVHSQYSQKGIAAKIINMLVSHCRKNRLHTEFLRGAFSTIL